MYSQKVLVFGGGLIGAASAIASAERGDDVTVVTRAPPPQRFNAKRWLFGDIRTHESSDILRECDAVVYAAGSIAPASQINSVASVLAEQVIPVVALAEAAARAGVKSFTFISSGGTVYGPSARLPSLEQDPTSPINAYGMIKVQTEQALLEVARRSGMTAAILRVSNPYGPGQSGSRRFGFIAAAVEAIQQNRPLTIWGDGSNTRDFVFIDDVADAVVRSTQFRGGKAIINIGSGQSVSLNEVCAIVSKVAGRKLEIRFEPSRAVDVHDSALDISKAASMLGWTATTDLDTGIQIMLGDNLSLSSVPPI